MSSVHVCPVCNGRGTVSAGFYNPYDASTTAMETQVTCRACGGKGVIITPEPSIYPPCKPVPTWRYPWWKYNEPRWGIGPAGDISQGWETICY